MRRLLLILAMLPGMALASPAPSSPRPADGPARTLVLCFEDSDVPPWRKRDLTGHNFRLLDLVQRDVGVRFVYRALPWRRCHADLAEGKVDASFANSYLPERLAMGVYPPGDAPGAPPRDEYRMYSDGYVLVRRRGSAVHLSEGRIVGLDGPVGSQSGYSILADLKRQGIPVEEGTPDPMALLRKVANGRLGAGALGINKMRELQASGDPVMAAIEVLPEPLVRKPYFLLLSHQLAERDPQLATALWEAIARHRDAVEPAPASGDSGAP